MFCVYCIACVYNLDTIVKPSKPKRDFLIFSNKKMLSVFLTVVFGINLSFSLSLPPALPLSLSLFLSLSFLGPHVQHMEVPRLGVESELQLPAYATATATQGPSRVCSLYHSSWQCQIPDPLREAGEGTHIRMATGQICFRCTQQEFLLSF